MNVAAEEVLEAGFVDGVRLVLREPALPATMLQLELDASDPLRSETLVSTRLQQLRDEGVRLAIDGASPLLGSGSAGVDADSVHLQRRWVRGIAADASVAASVAALSSGPSHRGHGVRHRCRGARGRRATSLGCDHAQGYLYCDPVPAEALGWLDCEQSRGEGREHEQAPPPCLRVEPGNAVGGGRLPATSKPAAASYLPTRP